MMLLGTQRVDAQGHLEIGGCDAVELARRFGTPLYVMDEQWLRARCAEYRQAFQSRLPTCLPTYAGKAFLCLAMARIVDEAGLGLDVASGGELLTALRARFPAERILLHGNNKSVAEMEMAMQAGVGRIVVDSEQEILALQEVAARLGVTQDIYLRLTPGVKPQTHTYIQTGQIDSKFGLAIATGQAMQGVHEALAQPNLRLVGVHCHIGSSIYTTKPFTMAVQVMMEFMGEVRKVTGHVLGELDLGGGLGVRYQPEDDPPSLEEYAQQLVEALTAEARRHDLPVPRLLLEPGRDICGEAGITLYTVGVIKEIPGVRTYVSVDGGMSDNPRPALYQARYEAIVANRAHLPRELTVTVAGKHCECDALIPDLEVPASLAVGDILAVQTTGAYNFAMASNYNRFARPAVVLVAEGRAELIVERQSLDDVLCHDRLPERLQPRG